MYYQLSFKEFRNIEESTEEDHSYHVRGHIVEVGCSNGSVVKVVGSAGSIVPWIKILLLNTVIIKCGKRLWIFNLNFYKILKYLQLLWLHKMLIKLKTMTIKTFNTCQMFHNWSKMLALILLMKCCTFHMQPQLSNQLKHWR